MRKGRRRLLAFQTARSKRCSFPNRTPCLDSDTPGLGLNGVSTDMLLLISGPDHASSRLEKHVQGKQEALKEKSSRAG